METQYSWDKFLGELEPVREQLMLGEGLENDIALESGWKTVEKLFREQYELSEKKAKNTGECLDILEKQISKELKTYKRYQKAARNLGISAAATLGESIGFAKYAEFRGSNITPGEALAALGILGFTFYQAIKYGRRVKKGLIQNVSSPIFLEAYQVFGGDKIEGIVPAIRNAYQF